MHIAPTGFPERLRGYRFFQSTRPAYLSIGGRVHEHAARSAALDPDQFQDDSLNRI